jgi:glycosyltransferase involved in cell wall biosynthesis
MVDQSKKGWYLLEKSALLSLCMIVKDEEESLARCLDSARQAVDEIVIVDTGSTDKTKEICGKYQAKIYDFIWTESFAAARNFGIERAAGEWILWLDADEELELENAEEFRRALRDNEKDLLLIPLVNYYGALPPDPHRAYLYASHRLFRNHRGFQFTGNIHEHLNVREIYGSSLPETIPGVKIHHYGYMEPESRKKHGRNLQMLEKERSHPDYSPWIDYHLANEYYREERCEEAFQQVNLSISRFLERRQLPPSLLYKLKYDILISLGSFEGAWPGIEKAIALYPDYVDLHFYKGLILYAKGMYAEAIPVFQHCLELGEAHTRQYLTLVGCGGFQAWYFVGRCYESLGNHTEAAEAYTRTLVLYPGHEEAQSRLLQLRQNQPGMNATADFP